MRLKHYIEKTDLTSRRKIKVLLRKLSAENEVCQQVVSNLFKESRLTTEDWNKLFAELLKDRIEVDQVKMLLTSFCQKNILNGKQARILQYTVLGRVMPISRFCNMLVKMNYYNSLDEAEADVRYRINMDLQLMDRRWRSLKLGMYVMWSTFDLDGNKPFKDRQIIASEIVCALGLEPITGPLILFEYILPEDCVPRVPTVCDAYAGLVWSKYFYRVGSSSLYGKTMPTELCSTKKGKPEVVHEVIDADSLVTPLRYA